MKHIKQLLYEKIMLYGDHMYLLGKAEYEQHKFVTDEALFRTSEETKKEIVELINLLIVKRELHDIAFETSRRFQQPPIAPVDTGGHWENSRGENHGLNSQPHDVWVGAKPPVAQAGKDEGHTDCEGCKECGHKTGADMAAWLSMSLLGEWPRKCVGCFGINPERKNWADTPQAPKGKDAPDYQSLWNEIRFCCENNGMNIPSCKATQMDIIAFIRDLHARAGEDRYEIMRSWVKAIWEIDHIIPIALHNFDNPSKAIKSAYALDNLCARWRNNATARKYNDNQIGNAEKKDRLLVV